jgi:transposase-like protein
MQIPRCCTNPKCDHFRVKTKEKWYSLFGTYHTKLFGEVQRFKCKSCGKTFSVQTFSTEYYIHIRVNEKKLFDMLLNGAGNRGIARSIEKHRETVQNRIERYSRWCQGIHNIFLQKMPLTEGLAADGLESFCGSQYHPNNINLIVGRYSLFTYGTGLNFLRRKGRMTKYQKAKRSMLERKGKAHPRDTQRSMTELSKGMVKLLQGNGITNKEIWTDEHKQYPKAFHLPEAPEVFDHKTISSKIARTFRNPLYAVNYQERENRKNNSDHARETVCYARHPACMMCRMMVHRHHHNYEKSFHIKDHKETSSTVEITHAQKAGLDRAYMDRILKEYRGKRIFLNELDLDGEERKTWLMEWKNPGGKSKSRVPKHLKI